MNQKSFSFQTIDQFVGQELGLSDWVAIDQDRVDQFADCTGDHQWIHVDREKARHGPMGTTIAHGFLLLSLLPKFHFEMQIIPGDVAMALNYGTDRIRFTSPVPTGSRVRCRSVLQSAASRPDGGLLLNVANTLEIEGAERPAMVAETLTLIYGGG